MNDRRYFKIVCAIENLMGLDSKLRGTFFFGITFIDEPMNHYFILTDITQQKAINKFAEANGFAIKEIKIKELIEINPTKRKHVFRGSIHLSPWDVGLNL